MNYEPRTIRLCVVSALYHPSLGGLGRQAQLLTERLAEDGVRVFVIARKMKGVPPAEFSPKVKVLRAWSLRPQVYHMPEVNLVNLFTSLSFCITCSWLLWKYRNQYDMVHFHGAGLPLVVNLPLLKLLRKKVIAKVAAAGLGTEAGSLRGRYFGMGTLLAKLLQKVDAFVAISEEIKEGLLRDRVEEARIWRIPNFVDLRQYRRAELSEKLQLRRRLKLPDGILVIYSGRFVQRKGIKYLLEAWVEVQREFPQARLLLLGDGQTHEDMKRYAERLGISKSVLFLGHVSNVQEYFCGADLFVLPSLQEGLPNALLEAMAVGLPVVATCIGGVEDVVENEKNGLLVPPADSRALAEAIKRLISDKDFAKELAHNGYLTVKERFSLDRIVKEYVSLYERLILN
jgi:glycosyltransferase involved in cell wall biosynthesis